MSFNNLHKAYQLSDAGLLNHLSATEFSVFLGAMTFANNEDGKGIWASDESIARRIRSTRSTVTKAINKLIYWGFFLCRIPGSRRMLDINVKMLDDSLIDVHLKRDLASIPERINEFEQYTQKELQAEKYVEQPSSYRTSKVPMEHISNPLSNMFDKLKKSEDINIHVGENSPIDLSHQRRCHPVLVDLLKEKNCYDGLIVRLMSNYNHQIIYHEATGLLEKIKSNTGMVIRSFAGVLEAILQRKHGGKHETKRKEAISNSNQAHTDSARESLFEIWQNNASDENTKALNDFCILHPSKEWPAEFKALKCS